MKADCALIVFAKNPELGKVKTRLAKDVGEEEALRIYKLLLDHTRQETTRSLAACYAYYTTNVAEEDGWKAEKRIQVTGDLGTRMSAAFREQLHHHDRVCIIGTDCAGLTAEKINQAFEALDEYDFVIGPANDGGYYLLGMKAPGEELFEQISWSSEEVLSQTIDRIKGLGKRFYLLPELIDVDTIEDWEMVKEKFK